MEDVTTDKQRTASQSLIEVDVNSHLTEEDKKRLAFVENSYPVILEYIKDPLYHAMDTRPRDEIYFDDLEERYRFLSLLFDRLADDCHVLYKKGDIIEKMKG